MVYYFITAVIAYRLRQIYSIEAERGKCIRHHRTEFGRNHVVSDGQKGEALEEPSNCSRWYLVNLVMP